MTRSAEESLRQKLKICFFQSQLRIMSYTNVLTEREKQIHNISR